MLIQTIKLAGNPQYDAIKTLATNCFHKYTAEGDVISIATPNKLYVFRKVIFCNQVIVDCIADKNAIK